MKSTVLGCGRWGTYIAHYLNSLGHETFLWGRESSGRFNELRESRSNSYLELEPTVTIGSSLEDALAFSDRVFISISSQQLRSLCSNIKRHPTAGKTFILCMKGLENETGLRLTEVLEQELGNEINTAVWVGPGHVQNFLNGIPSCMIIDSDSEELSRTMANELSSDLIRIYFGNDLVGTEIGAAAKNVVGIAAGMLDGLGYHSLKGALMARGASEFSRLVTAMGGDPQTVYGLSHLGDYEATLFSPYSHNRAFGEAFARSEVFEGLAEGVTTVKSLVLLSKRYDIDLPISKAVYSVLYEGLDIKDGIMKLFSRPLKQEFYT